MKKFLGVLIVIAFVAGYAAPVAWSQTAAAEADAPSVGSAQGNPSGSAGVLSSGPAARPQSAPPSSSAATVTMTADDKKAASGSAQPSGQLVPTSSFGLGPKPIVIEKPEEDLDTRLKRNITLDVREMNVIDVLKFLAMKGDFNLVTSSSVSGRVTLYLKNITIGDALDIILISNSLAYYREKEVIHAISGIEYESMFGKRFNEKMEVAIVQLKYAKPSYILAALDNLKSNLGRIIIDEDTGSVVLIDTPQSIENMKKTIAGMEEPLDAIVYTLQYAKADVVAEKLRGRLEGNTVGSVTMDERTNQLIIRAFPGRRAEIERLIASLDTPTKEVLVEARILQVVFKPQYDYGIDWDLDFQNSSSEALKKFSFKNVFLDEDNLTSSSPLNSIFGRMGVGNLSADDFEVAIRALKQVNDTKILSNPKILVTNNEEAKIHIGDTVPYIISTTSGTGDNAITSEDVRFVDVGLKLNVTPTINEDGFVTMRLKPEISTVTEKIQSEGGGIPQVNKTEVETTVMVKDGATIILGGLKKDNKVHTKKGFPFLMDVPILRVFFSSTSESIESTEIVIFITPHVVTGTEALEMSGLRGTIKPGVDFKDKTPDAGKPAGAPSLSIKE